MESESERASTPVDAGWQQRLTRALAQPGRPVALLVEGLAGSGKSRLVRRIERFCGKAAPVRLAAAFSPSGRLLARPGHDSEPAALDEPDLDVLGADGPALVVLEDVHLATADQADAVRRALETTGQGLVVVLSYRPEELAVPGLVLGESVSYPPGTEVVRVTCPPLTRAEVRRIAETALGEERCPAELVDLLLTRSGGVAQVVVDLVGMLKDTDDIPARRSGSAVDALGVPVRLSELVLAHTAALPPPQRPIVWAAAVLDQPVTTEELAAVAGLPDGREALLAALRCAALQEVGELRYGFQVPLAAAAVYQDLPGPVRQELHYRAAEMLLHCVPVPWAEVARHRGRAGRPHGWLRAVERAARQYEQAGRHQAAISLLEDALALPDLSGDARARLAPLLARCALVGLASDETVRVLRQIVADEALPPIVRGRVRLDLAMLLNNQLGLGVQARQEMELAAEDLHDQPDLVARTMSGLGMPYWPGASPAERQMWLKRAEAAAQASGDPVVRAAVEVNRMSAILSEGDPEGWRLLEELPQESSDQAIRQQAARGLCNAADAALWLGHYRRASELVTAGVDLSVRSGAPFTGVTGRGVQLLLDWFTGRWAGLAARAEALIAETQDLPAEAQDPWLVLGLLALTRGEVGQVAVWLRDQNPQFPDNSAVPLAAAASGALIRLALARAETEAAAAEARDCWDRLRRNGVWVWAAEPAPWAVTAVSRAGDLDAAREMIAEFAAGLTDRDAPAAHAALLWCQAVLGEELGDLDTAATRYREAAAAYALLPQPYAQALTTEAASRCALAAADHDREEAEVVSDLATCAQRLTELGASWDAARVRAALRDYRPVEARRPVGRPAYGTELSPREQEVAELAAAGLTNRDIALTLHLSPRTVEQHVAHAMRKLAAGSRQELQRHLSPPAGPGS